MSGWNCPRYGTGFAPSQTEKVIMRRLPSENRHTYNRVGGRSRAPVEVLALWRRKGSPDTPEAGREVLEQVERRKHRRLPLRLPLIISGGRESGHFVEETATENVSAGGVYFKTDLWAQMPVGTRLCVVIEIPPADQRLLQPNRLQTVGRVVRISPPMDSPAGSDVRGVAVKFERALRFSS